MKKETVKTKKRFLEIVKKMGEPILYCGADDSFIYANKWFLVKDNKDPFNITFYLQGCKISHKKMLNYNMNKKKLKEYVDNYDKKESLLTEKYNKWIDEYNKQLYDKTILSCIGNYLLKKHRKEQNEN